MPISTTHAMVSSLVGIGIAADAVQWHAVMAKFFVPLLVSPLIALAGTALLYPLLRLVRRRTGVTHETCVCVGEQVQPVAISVDGAMRMQSSGVTLTADQIEQCRQRYGGRVVGVDAQRVLDAAHYVTAGAVSFARGLNDTPKIAALLFTVSWLTGGWSLALVGVAIAAGGLLAVRRVAQTMSYRITDMNDGQAFTANLVTAALVIFASKWGMPVSTTHVSCGSLFGIGAATGQARWRVIGTILLAWITTLPVAAMLGFLAWRVLGLQ
jgi:PiT family inorganic phosphate transporter